MSKQKKSAVWTYFDGEEVGVNPTCTLCGETVKTSGNTSNLLKNLKSKHEEQAKLVQAEQEEEKRLKAEQTPAEQPRQVTLKTALERSQLYGKESPRHKKIDEALVRMLSIDLQPASIVEDRGFLIFCTQLTQSKSLQAVVPS